MSSQEARQTRPRPLYLDAGEEQAFAFVHGARTPAQGTGVLIVPPFGWDEMCSYRPRREWADSLAERGYPTLRLDLPGSGNAGGSPRDPDRLEAWLAAVDAAARLLLAEPGCESVAAIGIGLGGMLACAAIARGTPIDDVALWAVPARGRALVRELEAFARIKDSPAVAGPPPDDGSVASGGYVLSAETAAALKALDLTRLSFPSGRPRRALLFDRDGIAVDERLKGALAAAGAEVELATGEGYGRMMTVIPQEARPATAVLERIDAWLAGGPSVGARDRAGAAAQVSEALFVRDGVREAAIEIPQPFGWMFGVITEPSDAPPAACAVLLNAGAQRHTGPNRMWVEMARRWAERGIATLRLDVAGIGDAEGDASGYASDEAFYVHEFIGQLRAALDALEERGYPPRFLVGGLCAGAYWALHESVEDERVAGLLLLNPRMLLWDPWKHAVWMGRDIRRKMLMPSRWLKVLRGKASWRRPVAIAAQIVKRLAHAPLWPHRWLAERQHARRAGGDRLDLMLDRVRDAGVDVLMVFAGREPLHEDFKRSGRIDRMGRWPNIELRTVELPEDTHTLGPIWLQREVHGHADEAVERLLRVPALPDAAVGDLAPG